jgi:tetratricopeptide (TPR) repeat protein
LVLPSALEHNRPVTIKFGDAAMGSYSISFGPLTDSGFAAHVNQGQLGISFSPGTADEMALEAYRLDGIDFLREMKMRFGGWGGMTMSSAGRYWQKGQDLATAGDYARALEVVTAGLQKSSRSWRRSSDRPSDVYDSLGAFLDSEGPPLEIATEDVPDLGNAFRLRGRIRLRLGDITGALQDFRESQTLLLSVAAAIGRAHCEDTLGRAADAITTLEACCRQFRREDAYRICGQLLVREGRVEEGARYLRQADQVAADDRSGDGGDAD